MKTLVIDASVAIKWVVEEERTPQSLALREQAKLIAPDLLTAECANILWKKVRRDELSSEEALLAARLLQHADIELLPMRSLFETATRMAIELDHPAYDCVYLALALEKQCQFVTADDRFVRKVAQSRQRALHRKVVSLAHATER